MSTQPEFLKLQAEQKDRDRQVAIDIAVAKLQDAEAEFKIEIETINRCFDALLDPNFKHPSVSPKHVDKQNYLGCNTSTY